jgi:hypothetical protein
MKKVFLIVALCSSSMMLFAQQNHRNPPQSVQRSWQKDYPNHDNQTWEYRNNQWHTKYTDNDHGNRDVDVYYDRNGHRAYSQSRWDRNDLPNPVRDRIKTRYHSENYDALRIERPGRGFYFQITLGGNKKVYLDERGREVRNH